ncbi:amidase signature domain-containing protein [Aspergillus karnatakaensis]|uniref:amidase signature domain-containing protein n=1 Tax=Aspergillus karnatakaensis TaxID=1810916 RepID=UPI003CCD4C0B
MPPPYAIPDWHSAATTKRQTRDSKIPQSHLLPPHLAKRAAEGTLLPSSPEVLECGILTDLDIEITSINDAAVLRDRIAERTYTAVDVLTAYTKRASIAQQTINCLTEILYDEGLERARYLDEYLERTGKTIGSLHGIPISLKDLFAVKGVHATAGLVSWIPNISTEDSSVVKNILSAGGVLYAKTNVSQGHLMVESINNVFGTTGNPFNASLSAGGSSGGEAALVGALGSIIGSATDGGGSIRFPAAFCGLWGVKCSKGRIGTMGIESPGDGNESTNAGLGPVGRSVSGCEMWIAAQLEGRVWEWDFNVVPMAWDGEAAERVKGRLVVGVVWDDGVVKPTPPVTRAVGVVVEVLRRAGHTVVDLPAEEIKRLHRRGTSCVMKANVQGGGVGIMRHIDASGEPVVPRTATGSAASLLTTHEVFANHKERAAIAREYNSLWTRYGLDTILAPAVAHPAPPHGKYISNAYAGIYNMLDYVTGSVPVTTVDLEKDVASREWYEGEVYERIEEERFPYDWGDKEMKEVYTGPEVFANAPVGVQLVCRRLREEKCVGILKEVEALLGEK